MEWSGEKVSLEDLIAWSNDRRAEEDKEPLTGSQESKFPVNNDINSKVYLW